MNTLTFLLSTVIELYTMVLLLRIWMQWAHCDFYNPFSQFVVKVTQPIIGPLRRVIPAMGPIDSASLLVAYILSFIKAIVLFKVVTFLPIIWIAGLLILLKTIGLLIFWVLLVMAIMSWVSQGRSPIEYVLIQLADPLLRPIRRLLPAMGGIDFSPMILVLLLYVINMGVAEVLQATGNMLLPGLWTVFSAGDEQALSDYLTSQGRLRSFLTLWFLAVVQVLSLVIPAMPVQLAAGLAYGPWLGFVTSFSASAVANLTVFLAARRLAPVIRRLVADNPKAAKLLDSVRSSKDPWFYTILAFITPGLPNGIIPYAAANAGMCPKQFLAAIFISLPFPTLLTCAAGSFMLEGNWLFTVLTGIVLFSFVGILFFNRTKFIAWAHEVKNRHTQKAGA